jgi:putative intracellular protease/amidase/DNA-directed RNA polymerase subunit RPC12/RpoP
MAVLAAFRRRTTFVGMNKKIILLAPALLLFTCVVSAQVQAKVPAIGDSIAYFCGICGSDCDTIAFAKEGVCPHCGMKLIRQGVAERRALLNNYHKKMSICFYLQDGVEVLDFAGPMEVFSYAGFQVFVVSRKKEPLVSQGILKIMPDYSIEDAPPSDILAFFGGNADRTVEDKPLIDWIRSREAGTQYFFSVCTGAFIMGKAGILDSLTATTFHSSIASLRKALPSTRVLENVRFVDNGRVITTAGISAGIDGALHLVAKLKGEGVAREVAEYMEYDKWVPEQGLIVQH